MNLNARIDYSARVDPAAFFSKMSEAAQQRYFKADLTDYLYLDYSARAHAVAYLQFVFTNDVEDAWPMGDMDIVSDYADTFRSDSDMTDDEWNALVTACPWIDTDTPPEDKPADPGGTSPMNL